MWSVWFHSVVQVRQPLDWEKKPNHGVEFRRHELKKQKDQIKKKNESRGYLKN